MKKLYFLIIYCFFSLHLHAAETYFVYDLWTNKPVTDAEIIFMRDSLRSDSRGAFLIDVKKDDPPVIDIKHPEYFDAQIDLSDISDRLIYLMPMASTDKITVVSPKASDNRLLLPANITRLDLESAEGFGNGITAALDDATGILIKSYGAPGQLQTISLRGMSAEQTQVLFDGIPINSMQTGSINFAELNGPGIGAADIYRGGNSLFGGSGAIGGTIDLHPPKLHDEIRYDLLLSAGSFDNHNLGLEIDLPVSRYRQKLITSRTSGSNDFSTKYENKNVTLKNRDYRNFNISYNSDWQITESIKLSGYWSHLNAERGAPKGFINPGQEKQNKARIGVDNNFAKMQLKYGHPLGGMLVQGYLRNEWLDYRDPATIINEQPLQSLHFNRERGLQLRGRFLPHASVLLHFGGTYSRQGVESSETGEKHRTRRALYLISDWEVLKNYGILKSVHLNGSLRYESYSDFGNVLLPAAGLNFKIKNVHLFTTLGKNYRAPTFNELYWQPGGNPDIKPESADNVEAGIEYHTIRGFLQWSILASGNMNRVKNRIRWIPGDGYSVYADNVWQVESKGIELESTLRHINGLHQIKLAYSFRTTEKTGSRIKGDQTIGNQLPFLPREQWLVEMQTGYRFLQAAFNLSRTSFRYLTLDNTAGQILPSYLLGKFRISAKHKLLNHQWRLTFLINNLFDKEYQVMPGYPMPPRNYQLTLSVNFQNQ